MFDGKKIKSVAPDRVEDDVIIHNKLPEIVSFAKGSLKTIHQGLAF
jgi:hypothetical protein